MRAPLEASTSPFAGIAHESNRLDLPLQRGLRHQNQEDENLRPQPDACLDPPEGPQLQQQQQQQQQPVQQLSAATRSAEPELSRGGSPSHGDESSTAQPAQQPATTSHGSAPRPAPSANGLSESVNLPFADQDEAPRGEVPVRDAASTSSSADTSMARPGSTVLPEVVEGPAWLRGRRLYFIPLAHEGTPTPFLALNPDAPNPFCWPAFEVRLCWCSLWDPCST